MFLPLPVAIVLAAGASRRMGRCKALLPLGGRPLVAWQVERLAQVADGVVVVAGPQLAAVTAAVAGIEAVRVVHNPRWATTQMVDSLRRGARAAAPDRDLLITPVDVAPAAPSLLERLAAAHGSAVPHGPDGDGHPVRLSADLRPRLDTFLEHGLRSLLLDASRIPFPAPVAADFDVPSSWATFVTAWEEGGDG